MLSSIILWAGFFPAPAFAQDERKLNSAHDYLNASMAAFINEKQLLGVDVAAPALLPVDLNNDTIMEWIAYDPACPTDRQLCRYVILAGNTTGFVALGTFNALKISPSSQYTHGVRDILVYNNLKNEFKHDTVKWNSAMSSYTPLREVALP